MVIVLYHIHVPSSLPPFKRSLSYLELFDALFSTCVRARRVVRDAVMPAWFIDLVSSCYSFPLYSFVVVYFVSTQLPGRVVVIHCHCLLCVAVKRTSGLWTQSSIYLLRTDFSQPSDN